jgi:hypothetical protein
MNIQKSRRSIDMPGTPHLRIRKYFGSASIQEMTFSLDEARDFLAYFFTKDGGSNVMIAVGGKFVKSFDELANIATEECNKNNAFIDVGLYLASEGWNHIST